MMATALTPDAQAHLDRYLGQVRAALRGHRAVDAEEVERDVIGHVNAELGERQEPVTMTILRGVLERLGKPEEWIPADELPLWRRIVHRTRFGPEDWRLAYLTFALWAIGPLLGPVGPLFLIASFPVARATLALMHEHGEPVGARAWLIYPPLVLFYIPLAIGLVIWPAPLLIAGLEPVWHRRAELAPLVDPVWITFPGVVTFGVGLWWIVIGMILSRATQTVQLVFWPFADWFEPRHAKRLMVAGVVLFLVGAIALAIAVLT
jgi:hypothetical protein